MTGKRVLVVEPDPVTASSLCQLCQRHGYAVTAIKEGKHAIAKTVEFKPSLIIVRAELEDVSGLSLCNRFRESTAFRHLPILILTSSGHSPAISKHMSGPSRANAYLALPVNPEKLLRQLENLLSIPKENKPSAIIAEEKTQIAPREGVAPRKSHAKRSAIPSRAFKAKAISSRQHSSAPQEPRRSDLTNPGLLEGDPADAGREKTGKQDKDLPWGLDGKMEFLRDNLKKKELEIADRTAQLEKNGRLVEQCQAQLQAKENELQAVQSRKDELERELGQAHENAELSTQQFQHSVQDLRKDKAHAENELNRVVFEKERRVQEMGEEIAQIEHEKDQLVRELQAKVEESERQYALISEQMRSVIAEKVHEHQQLSEIIEEQREENKTQEHDLQTLRHQLDHITLERTQVESALHTRLRQAEEVVSQLESQMQRLAGDKDEVEAFLQGELNRMTDQTNQLESALCQLKEDAHQQSQTYVEMIAERDHKIQHMDSTLQQLSHEKGESDARWERAYNEKTAEVKRLQDTNDKLQLSRQELKQTYSQQSLDLQAQLTALHDTIDLKHKAMEEQRSKQEQQEAQIAQLRKRHQAWSQSYHSEKDDLEKKLGESDREKTRIQQALQATQQEQHLLSQQAQVQLKACRQDSKREEIRERFRQHIEMITQRNKNELMSVAPNRDQSSDRTQKAPNPVMQNLRKQIQNRAESAPRHEAAQPARKPIRENTQTVIQEELKTSRRPPSGSAAPPGKDEESTREYTLEILDQVG